MKTINTHIFIGGPWHGQRHMVDGHPFRVTVPVINNIPMITDARSAPSIEHIQYVRAFVGSDETTVTWWQEEGTSKEDGMGALILALIEMAEPTAKSPAS